MHETNSQIETKAQIGQIRLKQDETRNHIGGYSANIQRSKPFGSHKNDREPNTVEKVGNITRLYSCDVCDYVARLPHHLRVNC